MSTDRLSTTQRFFVGLVAFGVVCWLNWLICSQIHVAFGGSAELQNVRGNQFFLSSHGRLTEVSSETFWNLYYYRMLSDLIAAIVITTSSILWLFLRIRR